jgi:C-terminal processing protease CtpA/Prc
MMVGIRYNDSLEVTEVEPGGPADLAGMHVGDVIGWAGEAAVTQRQQIDGQLLGVPGKKVYLGVVRGEKGLGFRMKRRCLPELGCQPPPERGYQW